MDGQTWLLLTDYASKYRISVSTLRRRIKSHQIPFRFENGKYLLLDDSSEEQNVSSVMAKTENIATDVRTEPIYSIPMRSLDFTEKKSESKTAEAKLEEISSKDVSNFSAASKLVNELKAAYMQTLQEKDLQNINLKREISDLKTLVRVLEEDNDRMRSLLGFKIPNS